MSRAMLEQKSVRKGTWGKSKHATQEKLKHTTQEQTKHTRRVPSSTTCEFCGGRFWAPKGEVVCPHCGKRVRVASGIIGHPGAFFRTYLEGLGISGAFSTVQVRYPYLRQSRRSAGLSDAYQKVTSEKPHQKRTTEGQNREKKLQESADSNSDRRKGEIV